MKRFTTLIAMLALAAAACAGGASPAATPAPVTPAPTATLAPVTPAPTATPVTISTAVTWDGKTCTYAGPATVPFMATVKFTLANEVEAKFASLYVVPVQEGTTWEQVLAWAKAPDTYEPSFFTPDDPAHFLSPGEAESSPLTAVITRDLPYLVVCDSTGQAGAGLVSPAVLLSVLKG